MRDCVGPQSCELHRSRAWAGPAALCERTGLPYRHCCGAKPVPLEVAELLMRLDREGVDPGSAEFRRRTEEMLQRNRRLHRRPKPLNHLLPNREGAPRQTSHDRIMRELTRKQMRPSFDRAADKVLDPKQ